MLRPMLKQEPGKYGCHFCKASLNVNYWAFVKGNDGLTKSVPCCERCAKKFERREKQLKDTKNVLNQFRVMWRAT